MRFLMMSVLASLLLLSGCSKFQPHQVDLQALHPKIDTKQRLPEGLTVEVETRDLRPDSLIGYRISRLSDRAPVELALPANMQINQGAKVALVKLGATPVASNAEVKLVLVLTDLSYSATVEALQTVTVKAGLEVKASKYNRSYTGNYNSQKQHQFVATPDLQENQAIVQEIILETLSRAFSDPQLLDFISQ